MKLTSRSWLRVLATAGIVSLAPAVYAQDPAPAPADAPAAEAAEEPAEQEPATATDAPASRKAALRAVEAASAKLAREGASGAGWSRFLDLPALRARLAAPPTEPLPQEAAALRTTVRRLRRGVPGIERSEFVAIRTAVAAHLAALLKANSPDFNAEIADLVKARDASFAAWLSTRSAADRRATADAVVRLEERGQYGPKTRDLVARNRRPNLVFHAGEPLLAAAMEQGFDDTSPVSTRADKAVIRGVARTTGTIDVELVDSNNGAVIGVCVLGHTATRTTATQGKVRVGNAGSTNFTVRSSLTLHGDGLHVGPVSAASSTDIDVTGVSTSFKRPIDRIVKKIVPRAIEKREGEIEAEANAEARRRAESEFSTRLYTEAAKANGQIQTKFYKPLREEGAAPQSVRFTSWGDYIHGHVLQSRSVQLAAVTDPPSWDRTALVSGQVHESYLENFAYDVLAGRQLGPKEMEALALKYFGRIPDEFKDRDPDDVAAIEFDSFRPASFALADGNATVILHVSSFYANDRKYGAMNIQADYRFELVDGKWNAVRQGDLKITPPSGRLGSTQIAMRRILRGQFDKLFKERVEIKPVVLEGPLAKLGSLAVKSIQTQRGWLTAALDPTAPRYYTTYPSRAQVARGR